MSWELMSLATAAADELGADVATVRVAGLLEDDGYHLTGAMYSLLLGWRLQRRSARDLFRA